MVENETMLAEGKKIQQADGKTLTVNMKYKDTIFRMLFSDKRNLLSLYNALNGKDYHDPDLLEIVTLDNAIYMNVKNDLAFIVDCNMFLWEHQSTYNPNIPLRDLIYIAREYEKYIKQRGILLYSARQQKLPAPRFIVFYNGERGIGERMEHRLSDAYENFNGEPELELKVLVLNINGGHNRELLEQCQILKEYAQFVARVRRYQKVLPVEDAVDRAVRECIEEGILREFLLKNRAEVIAMSIFEYNQKEEEELMRREEYEIGQRDGIQIGEERERKNTEKERKRAEAEKKRAETERSRAETEKKRAETEKKRADSSEKEILRLKEILRKNGIM